MKMSSAKHNIVGEVGKGKEMKGQINKGMKGNGKDSCAYAFKSSKVRLKGQVD